MLARIRAYFATFLIVVFLPFIIIQIYILRHKDNGRWARRQCRWFFSCNQFNVEKIGKYDKEAQILIMNHQSVTDIIYFEGFHPANLCWVAKSELGKIPLYGHALKAPDMILIDREDKSGIVFLLKKVKQALEQGRMIAIFPEGTRSNGGERLLPFKPGAKVLVSKLKLKIQPAVLVNTRKLYSTSPMAVQTNRARIVLMEAFVPNFDDDQWYEKLQADMQRVYLQHYGELNTLDKA